MFASLKWILAIAALSLLSFVESAIQPTKEFIVDTDLFDAIEYGHVPNTANTLTYTTLAILQRSFSLPLYQTLNFSL